MFAACLSALRGKIALALSLPILATFLAGTVGAQDLIDQVRRKNEIESQRIEAAVSDALVSLRRLDADAAVARLKAVLNEVEANQTLAPGRRDSYIRLLKGKLQAAQEEAARTSQPGKAPARKTTKQTSEQKAAETASIKTTLKQIDSLSKNGQTAEANRLAGELLRRYPDHPAVQASSVMSSITNSVSGARLRQGDRNARTVAAMDSVDRSSLPPKGDVEFPSAAKWKAMTERRKMLSGSAMSKKEQAIMKALATTLDVNFDNTPFDDAIQYISTKIGQPIILDKDSYKNALISSETTVSFNHKGIAARTVLRKLLADVGLAYVVKDEVIQVFSREKAADMVVTKAYPLGNLISGGMYSDAGIRFNPVVDQYQTMQNVMSIIKLIQSVEPQTWAVNGGKGTISYNAAARALVITQSAEVHSMLGLGR